MTAEHRVNTMADIAALTPEQFGRMLPDLIAWYEFTQAMRIDGVKTNGFVWVDDGNPGEVTSVYLTDLKTGIRHELPIGKAGAT